MMGRRLAPRRAVINLTDGSAMIGDLRLSWPWTVRLTGAAVVGRGGDQSTARKIDGVVIVPRRAVLFIQIT